MGKDVEGWIQLCSGGDRWASIVDVGALLGGIDEITRALVAEGGLLADSGLPDDLDRARDEPWVRAELDLDHGYGHTWFDWEDLALVLQGELDDSERATYRADPDHLVELRALRVAVRDALASTDPDVERWRLLMAMVAPLVDRFGPRAVRCVAWFTR